MMTARAKALIHQDLARRINAVGGNVGDPEAITHDERSELKLLEGIVRSLELLHEKAKTKA